MPSCVVKWCKNNSKVKNKSEGISFHVFPTKSLVSDKWVAAIRLSRNEPEWQPSMFSVVCTDHFVDSDLYYTKQGLRRITRTGYPKQKLFPISNEADKDTLPPSVSSPLLPDLHVTTHQTFASTSMVLPSVSTTAVSNLPVSPHQTFASNSLVLPSVSTIAVSDLHVTTHQTFASTSMVFPSVSTTAVSDLPVSPHQTFASNSLVLPSVSKTAVSEKQTAPLTINQETIYDTPRKYKLGKQIKKNERLIKKKDKRIKSLLQSVRRLKNRNMSLKEIVKNLKSQLYRYRFT